MDADDTRSRLQALRVRVDALPGTEWKQWLGQLLEHVDALLGGFVDSLDCLAWRELVDARATLLHRGPGDETERAIVDVLTEAEAIADIVALERMQGFAAQWQHGGFLIAEDHAALLAWVRREMARCECFVWTCAACGSRWTVSTRSGTNTEIGGCACLECDEPLPDTGARERMTDHDELTGHIASMLRIDEGVARALCEAAGWPS